ncbi:hypothetical protein PSTG_01658 [Puccinia striiformis f. sp. tritici PST-78]|uniref:Uncharacterized protein n=1 Tax=Puccinia striiformis f. sp. tritici PST-78 TaxID=1165861 RepID=A0A0L0W0I9_9BASI|nr:hypothetical protein PSTG_01658 [Puccinia striiformis f. sp. tritici PST-78]
MEESIKKEIQAGQMFGPYSTDQLSTRFAFFRTNPSGAVVKGDGSVRPVNNLSFPRNKPKIPSVSSSVDKSDYTTTWDNFKTVSRFLRRQTEPLKLAIFDSEKACCQIPTAKSQWLYLLIKNFDKGILIDTRIAFGGVAGYTPIHPLTRSEELGVKTNPTKILPFCEEQKYIGFIWSVTGKTVRLPDDKKFQRIQQIKQFLKANTPGEFAQHSTSSAIVENV